MKMIENARPSTLRHTFPGPFGDRHHLKFTHEPAAEGQGLLNHRSEGRHLADERRRPRCPALRGPIKSTFPMRSKSKAHDLHNKPRSPSRSKPQVHAVGASRLQHLVGGDLHGLRGHGDEEASAVNDLRGTQSSHVGLQVVHLIQKREIHRLFHYELAWRSPKSSLNRGLTGGKGACDLDSDSPRLVVVRRVKVGRQGSLLTFRKLMRRVKMLIYWPGIAHI